MRREGAGIRLMVQNALASLSYKHNPFDILIGARERKKYALQRECSTRLSSTSSAIIIIFYIYRPKIYVYLFGGVMHCMYDI